MENTVQNISTVNYLNDNEIQFIKTEGGFLTLKVNDTEYKRVMLQRAFPLSMPAEYISVREVRPDREPGDEIGIIKSLASLSECNRSLAEEELITRYFTPEITKITKLKDERGFVYLEAETTSGARKITAANNSSSFIKLSAVRLLIVDVDGNRFDIPDMSKLDKKSLRNLEVVV